MSDIFLYADETSGTLKSEVEIDLGGSLIKNIATPVSASDASTKGYVDSMMGASSSIAASKSSKAIFIESPTASEDITWWYCLDAITFTELDFVITGTTYVNVTVRHDPNRSAIGNEVIAGGTGVSSGASGLKITTGFNDATVPASSWVWIETTGLSGTPTSLSIVGHYTED